MSIVARAGRTMRHHLPSLLDTKLIRPMNRRETETFFQATLLEMTSQEEVTQEMANKMGDLGRLFFSRIQFYGGKVTLGAFVVCATVSGGVPGNLVLYAFTLSRLYNTNKEKPVNVMTLANLFPWGFPTEEGLLEIWDAQKGSKWGESVDNMLDNPNLLTDFDDAEKKEWVKWLKS